MNGSHWHLKAAQVAVVVILLASLVTACAPTPVVETVIETVIVEQTSVVEVEKEVIQTVVVEKEVVKTVVVETEVEKPVIQTVVVEKEVQVTAVPEAVQYPWPMPPDAANAQHGGTLRVPVQEDLISLDPANGWDWNSWIVFMNGINNCLYNFGHNMDLYLDLAEDWPEISEDGTVYTIKVREGVKFHNGRELEAADLKYSMERAMWPETQGWGAEYMAGIVGAQDVIDGNATEVEGIKAIDKYTLQIELAAPDASFVYQFAQPYNCAVAKEDVEEWGEDFFRHGSGTGPYMLEEWVPGERVTLVKNPEYFHPDKPYIDRIEYTIGVAPEVALLQVEAGEMDLLHDMIPSGDVARILSDPTYEDMLIGSPTVDPVFLAMNNNVPPFDNVLVRRAIAHAVDKENILRVIGGQGEYIEGILPTGFPGRDPDLKWYEYDPDKARELLAEAGYPDGFETVLHTDTEDPLRAQVAAAIQADLKEVGIDMDIEVTSLDVMMSQCEELDACPMAVSSWVALWGDPSGILSTDQCHMAPVPNWAKYCNQELEDLITQANQTSSTEERTQLLQKGVEMVREDVPRFGLYTRVTYSLRSPELQGTWVHPTARWFYEDFWLDR